MIQMRMNTAAPSVAGPLVRHAHGAARRMIGLAIVGSGYAAIFAHGLAHLSGG
jgi:hypothetical protein